MTCPEIAFIPEVSERSDIVNAFILNDHSLSDHSLRPSHAAMRTVRSVRSDSDVPIRTVRKIRSETDDPIETVRNGRFRNPSPPLSPLYLFLPLYLMQCHENSLAKAI